MCLQTARPSLWVAPYKRGLAGKVALLEGGSTESEKRQNSLGSRSNAFFLFFSKASNLHLLSHSLRVCSNHKKTKKRKEKKKKSNLPHDATALTSQKQRHRSFVPHLPTRQMEIQCCRVSSRQTESPTQHLFTQRPVGLEVRLKHWDFLTQARARAAPGTVCGKQLIHHFGFEIHHGRICIQLSMTCTWLYHMQNP